MIDFCIDKGNPILIKDVDIIIQQLNLLFDTNTDEVFAEDYGTWYEEFLYDLNVSNEYINEYTEDMITENINLMGFDVSVDTRFLEGTERDILLINIELRRGSEEYSKTYKLS